MNLQLSLLLHAIVLQWVTVLHHKCDLQLTEHLLFFGRFDIKIAFLRVLRQVVIIPFISKLSSIGLCHGLIRRSVDKSWLGINEVNVLPDGAPVNLFHASFVLYRFCDFFIKESLGGIIFLHFLFESILELVLCDEAHFIYKAREASIDLLGLFVVKLGCIAALLERLVPHERDVLVEILLDTDLSAHLSNLGHDLLPPFLFFTLLLFDLPFSLPYVW